MIVANVKFSDREMSQNNLKAPNFRKCDISKCIEQLNAVNWSHILSHSTVSMDVVCFYDVLNGIIRNNTPLKLIGKSNYPVWFSKALKACIAEKICTQKRFK